MYQLETIKMTVVSNIQSMEKAIGNETSSFESLISKTYDELHEIQNNLIKRYNESLSKATTLICEYYKYGEYVETVTEHFESESDLEIFLNDMHQYTQETKKDEQI